MRSTTGAWLHAQLSLLVAVSGAGGCGNVANPPADTAGASPLGGGGAHQAGSAALAGSGAQGGSAGSAVAQGGEVARGGEAAQGGELAEGGDAALGGAPYGGAPGLLCDLSTVKLTAGWQSEPEFSYVARVWDHGVGPTVQEESGVRCAGASSSQACESAYAALVPATSWSRGAPLAFQEYFTYTRGDDVGTIGSFGDLQQALGSIDTPNEAVVWLYVHQRQVHCDQLETRPNGYLAHSQKLLSDCPITYQPVDVLVAPDGTLEETLIGQPLVGTSCAGRRPEGLRVLAGARSGSAVGDCFAEMAELELASIAAFAELESQLGAHGAPAPLLERCRSARHDEIRHARALSALARRFGAWPKWVRAGAQRRRSLLELALENAREGTVRELYGAAVATWQAEHAQDREVREVFGGVARDETEHAALAFDLGSWLDARLTEAERELVETERRRAVAELADELERSPEAAVKGTVGLPSAPQAQSLLVALQLLTPPAADQWA